MMKINHKEVGIPTRCPFCGHAYVIEVNEMDYFDWKNGMNAQDVFPYLSVNEREMLISGICHTCWNKYFGSDEGPDSDEIDIHGNTFRDNK